MNPIHTFAGQAGAGHRKLTIYAHAVEFEHKNYKACVLLKQVSLLQVASFGSEVHIGAIEFLPENSGDVETIYKIVLEQIAKL